MRTRLRTETVSAQQWRVGSAARVPVVAMIKLRMTFEMSHAKVECSGFSSVRWISRATRAQPPFPSIMSDVRGRGCPVAPLMRAAAGVPFYPFFVQKEFFEKCIRKVIDKKFREKNSLCLARTMV